MTLEEIRNLHEKGQIIDLQAIKEKKKLEEELNALKHKQEVVENAQALLQKVSKETQEHLKFQIEDIVNLALDTCFPNEYKFNINFQIKFGRTEAELEFISKTTGKHIDPMEASGGGVIELTALALRMASYALDKTCDNVLILDEPLKSLSRDLQTRARDILITLAKQLDIQIIIITHIAEMQNAGDRIFEVRKGADGISRVTVYEGME